MDQWPENVITQDLNRLKSFIRPLDRAEVILTIIHQSIEQLILEAQKESQKPHVSTMTRLYLSGDEEMIVNQSIPVMKSYIKVWQTVFSYIWRTQDDQNKTYTLSPLEKMAFKQINEYISDKSILKKRLLDFMILLLDHNLVKPFEKSPLVFVLSLIGKSSSNNTMVDFTSYLDSILITTRMLFIKLASEITEMKSIKDFEKEVWELGKNLTTIDPPSALSWIQSKKKKQKADNDTNFEIETSRTHWIKVKKDFDQFTKSQVDFLIKAIEWWQNKCPFCVGKNLPSQHSMKRCTKGGAKDRMFGIGLHMFLEGGIAVNGCRYCALPKELCPTWKKSNSQWNHQKIDCPIGSIVYDVVIELYRGTKKGHYNFMVYESYAISRHHQGKETPAPLDSYGFVDYMEMDHVIGTNLSCNNVLMFFMTFTEHAMDQEVETQ